MKPLTTLTRVGLAAALVVQSACRADEPAQVSALSGLDGVAFDTLAAVGVADGESWETFGRIREVALSESGVVAVLDGLRGSVFLFDLSGNPLDSIVGRGQGPGELQTPTNLAWNENNKLFVADAANGRISVYGFGPEGIQYMDSRSLTGGPASMCVSGERVFISAFRSGAGPIHEVGDEAGSMDFVQSFGLTPLVPGIEALDPAFEYLALLQWTTGRLYCGEVGGLLEVGILHPRVSLYEYDGRVVWERELQEFYRVTPIQNGPAFTDEVDDDLGGHVAQSVVPWDSERVLVQLEVRSSSPRPEDRDFHALESRLINLSSGVEEGRSSSLPLLMAAGDGRFVRVQNLPYPRLWILQRDDSGSGPS